VAERKAIKIQAYAMLVFTGVQGLGKSRFARWICPAALQQRYFLEADINTRDKDSLVRLMEAFIWEVGELDRTTRKQDTAELKQFISEHTVTVRRSYGRYDTRGNAMASLIGTVNGTEFLADETGNRRFYVIDLQRLDWSYQQLPVDQIWAETVVRYRRGESWRLLPEEDQLQTEHNRGFMADGIMGDYIRKHFFITGDPSHQMTAADILDVLHRRDVKLSGTDQGLANSIGRAMTALGVRRERSASSRYYVGICPR
jgi:putative DNA primase/helicase